MNFNDPWTVLLLRVVLTAENGDAAMAAGERLTFMRGAARALDALRDDGALLVHRDIYAAGLPTMLRELSHALSDLSVVPARIHIDSFGI